MMLLSSQEGMVLQALARAAGEGIKNNGELAALETEADMPLEELMALYGYVGAGTEPEQEAAAAPAEVEAPAGRKLHLALVILIPGKGTPCLTA